ncbi:MAG: sugar phosphate nucleotidyltransferase, partial [bacterium]|nr:sugar phosphate nucleotidyltransferase [bacterium]
QIKRLKEKPGPQATASRLASIGSYILTPDIFDELAHTPLRDNELYLPDAIDRLLKRRSIYAKLIEGEYFDIGSKFGWLQANLNFALKDKSIGGQLKRYLKKI